ASTSSASPLPRFFHCHAHHPVSHCFPTRRSSDLPFPTNILITGPSGTGKEVLAGMIHQLSSSDKKTFIKVNCGAIPAELFESEIDRKSTRLNSSHVKISYAVFCLQKKSDHKTQQI